MNDKISQEEIDNLLKAGGGAPPPANSANNSLSFDDMDTLGEIGNIFMGSASTTLSQLLSTKVDITTPFVEVFDSIQDSNFIKEDQLITEISYTEGLQGTVILALKKQDSAIIADLMMGGDGKIDTNNIEIGELQISAVGEAMNQMVGSASTTLSSMLNTPINISPPDIKLFEKGKPADLHEELLTKPIVTIKFNLIIGNLINSEIVQFMSMSSAKTQVGEVVQMMKNMSESLKNDLSSGSILDTVITEGHSSPINQPPQPPPPPLQQKLPPQQPQYQLPPPQAHPQKQVVVQPVDFSSFDAASNIMGEANRNLNLVLDVKLELTVELGKTELPIKNVLELTRGSIVELDKIAGEPVELYANGKLIAKGEVVVIEDNFGLRITNIVSPEQRIQDL